MERIASFCVDHTRLERGMYLSRQDGDVLTWDIRMKKAQSGRLPDHCCRPHAGASVCHLRAQQRREGWGDLCWPHGLPHRLFTCSPEG